MRPAAHISLIRQTAAGPDPRRKRPATTRNPLRHEATRAHRPSEARRGVSRAGDLQITFPAERESGSETQAVTEVVTPAAHRSLIRQTATRLDEHRAGQAQ